MKKVLDTVFSQKMFFQHNYSSNQLKRKKVFRKKLKISVIRKH